MPHVTLILGHVADRLEDRMDTTLFKELMDAISASRTPLANNSDVEKHWKRQKGRQDAQLVNVGKEVELS